jgi:hypothetical protein
MTSEDQLMAMELHDTTTIDGNSITRVIGGYIYHCNLTDVFVPDKTSVTVINNS